MTLDIIAIDDDDCRVRYAGGKGKCFQRLISLMPPHTAYIESHLGGGAVLRNKRPAEHNFGVDIDGRVIEQWRRSYSGVCTLVHGDAASFLANYTFRGSELVYADPPYYPEVRRRARVYRHDYTTADHVRLLEVLTRLPCMVMLSGYDNALYHYRLAAWRRITLAVKTQVDVREECVWANFAPPVVLHDASYLGATFRERQTIKRREHRMLDRFGRMAPVERRRLLELLNERYGHSA